MRNHYLREYLALPSLLLLGWPAVSISIASAETVYLAAHTLPYSGGIDQLQGDIVCTDVGAAAVYSKPDVSSLRMMFYRFGADGTILVEKQYNSDLINFYEPSLCWDGANYAVAFSTYTQSRFMMLSPDGNVLLQPLEFDRAPNGWRTAAFRVLWTGNAYAVFAIWAEPVVPGAANHYTHLNYWLLNGQGEILKHQDLGSITPISYPGFEGAEKKYYGVVWTGAAFFIVHQSEVAGFPPVFTSSYKMIDLDGNVIHTETPVFASITAKGAEVAANGQVIGVTALHEVPFYETNPGNYLYARFFDPNGDPLGPEVEYTDPTIRTGAGPMIFVHGNEFRAAYAMPESQYSLKFTVWLADFGAAGEKIRDTYPVTDPENLLVGDINLAFDLQLTGNGRIIFGKGQTGLITNSPIVFLIGETPPDRDDFFDFAGKWHDPLGAADLLDLLNRARQ
jgi:hypothetical protein